MLRNLGLPGILGVVLLIGGVALATWYDILVGSALAMVIAGLGLVVYGLVTNLMRAMGMGNMM